MLAELRHFVEVAEAGTFTEAARRSHISQPALTAAIQRLEAELGGPLFLRGRRGAALTAAGAALMPRARAALAAVEDGRRAVAEVLGLHAGEVRVGAGATACTYLLPPVLAAFRRGHPGIRFLLRETTTDEALLALHRGELDLAVVTSEQGEPWREDELVLVIAPGIDPGSAPYLTFRRGTTTRELFERHFPDVEVVMELGSIAAVKGNVRAGIGMALVSRSAVTRDLALGHLLEVPHAATPIRRMLHVVHRGVANLPPAAAALRLQLLSEAPPPRAARRPRPRKPRRPP